MLKAVLSIGATVVEGRRDVISSTVAPNLAAFWVVTKMGKSRILAVKVLAGQTRFIEYRVKPFNKVDPG